MHGRTPSQKARLMSETPHSNVKIYERPERKGPSAMMIVVGLIVLLAAGFVLYRVLHHSAGTAANPTGLILYGVQNLVRPPASLFVSMPLVV
jgi:multisubunit Na+/H+ antiporter MnhB subunit